MQTKINYNIHHHQLITFLYHQAIHFNPNNTANIIIITTNIFITLSANGLLACSSAASKCTTAFFVCVNVESMFTSILSINEPCSMTREFSSLYIVESLLIFLTSSSIFLLLSRSFFYSCIYSYSNPFIIIRCS